MAAAPADAFFNVRRVVTAPRRARPDVRAAAVAVGQLVERHEALRTRVRLVDGIPRQVVARTGYLRIEVAECAAEAAGAVARSMLDRLAGTRFDYTEDWPLRVGLVVADGSVHEVVLVLSHLSVDGHATDLLLRELRLLLLRGSVPVPPGLQPLGLARRQAAAGDRYTRPALAHWTGHYRSIPPAMFVPAGAAGAARAGPAPYRRALLTSAAAQAAARRVAGRARVSTSTVLLAAAAALVGQHTGHRTCAMWTNAGNRFQADHATLVGPMSQQGLFVLDLPEPAPLTALLPAAWAAAARAYRHGYYDCGQLNRALAAVSEQRGAEIHPHCCFNDVRAADEDPARAELPTAAAVRAAAATTTLRWQDPPERLHCRFCLELHDRPDGLGVLLTAHSGCLSAAGVEGFLHGLEASLVDAAAD